MVVSPVVRWCGNGLSWCYMRGFGDRWVFMGGRFLLVRGMIFLRLSGLLNKPQCILDHFARS